MLRTTVQSLADPIVELMHNDSESQYDLLEFRHATEGMMAYFAALRGTDADMQNIKNRINEVETATEVNAEPPAIVRFIVRSLRRHTMLLCCI